MQFNAKVYTPCTLETSWRLQMFLHYRKKQMIKNMILINVLIWKQPKSDIHKSQLLKCDSNGLRALKASNLKTKACCGYIFKLLYTCVMSHIKIF